MCAPGNRQIDGVGHTSKWFTITVRKGLRATSWRGTTHTSRDNSDQATQKSRGGENLNTILTISLTRIKGHQIGKGYV